MEETIIEETIIIEEQGGITDLQGLRKFIGSLPTKELKEEFKSRLLEERDHDLFTQEDITLVFISDNWDKLEKAGWLKEEE